MARVNAIQKEIVAATGVKIGAKDSEAKTRLKLYEAAVEADEKTVWDNFSDEVQSWVNACTDAKEAGEELPGFDDEVKAKAEPDEPEEKPKRGAKASKKAEEDEPEPEEKPARGKAKAGKASAKEDEKPKRGAKPAEKEKAKPAAKAKTKATGDGYKGHREGSRKGKVHEAYDDKGPEAAMKLADKLGIAESSARSWIGSWGGFGKKGK